jgi:ribonuclease-3 family protein
MNYFSPQLSEQDANKISMLGLAHIGDGVYELLVRTMLCTQGHAAVGELHRLTVARVRAPAQAKAMERLLPLLDEGELALYKRGRNAHVHGVPPGASVGEYHAATGLEALFGWLYLQGRLARIEELFAAAMEG